MHPYLKIIALGVALSMVSLLFPACATFRDGVGDSSRFWEPRQRQAY